MNRLCRPLLLLLILTAAAIPGVARQGSDNLPIGDGVLIDDGRQIRSMIEEGAGSDSFWAVVISDSSGTILESYNADHLVRPASVQKLLSSAAFLHLLGPDYRYRTPLFASGRQDGEVWRGDLLITGSGDPSLNTDFHNDPLSLFEKWTDLFTERGITRIEGNLIGNESYFDDVPWPQGWEWDDLSYYYAVETSALSFNSNVVDLEVMADGEVGTRPRIQWYPFNTPYVDFINEQVITPPATSYEESYRRLPGSNTILLRSTLPQGYYETEPLSINEPARYFIDTFRRYMAQRGVELTGQVIVDRQDRIEERGEWTLLDQHISVPLSDMIREMNFNSNNFYSEMLLKTLSAETYGPPGTTELGLQAVTGFLSSVGLDMESARMRDASGMAPANLVRASDLNLLLHRLRQMDHFGVFRGSLAVAGRSGTLEHRFRNSPVEGSFFGKSGYVSGVRTLAGYLRTHSGQELIVTLVTNNYAVSTGVIDQLHRRMLEYCYSTY